MDSNTFPAAFSDHSVIIRSRDRKQISLIRLNSKVSPFLPADDTPPIHFIGLP
ncbi:hypothetical protein PS710_00480 [Pseudomonas fluorescens]|uniref:Uncharacterized protein n=1 Tax=Pseudomonas fluorescens TaxID=294 RepID=A0A5E6ZZ69_PSEFL|nr:hypothetical protein PS710_00480 [Pseudomonas fluorescens]